jgi:hypothetical protein
LACRDRRVVLLLVVSLVVACLSATASQPVSIENAIVLENQHVGTNLWQLHRPGYQVADDVNQQIKGYASDTSVNKGESITLFVTVNPIQEFRIDVFRMGWYGGAGARLMQAIGPLHGSRQSDCPVDSVTGLVECRWTPSYTLPIPADWTSGVYLALLTNAEKLQNYIMFVVRDDARRVPLLYQQSVATYQAYNNYPNNGNAGKSLYSHISFGFTTIAGDSRAIKVSFDRPYKNSGADDFLEEEWSWEYYFIRWMERSGFDVSYSTDLDTHRNGEHLQSHRAFLVVGHDEYWSREMRDAVEVARERGVNLGFFGANDAYWQVRFEPSSAGIADRILVCYKDAEVDPIKDPILETIKFRDLGRAEQSLIGIQYASWNMPGANTPYVVANSNHWVYSGTRLRDGDSIPGIVGYEVDRLMPEHPHAPGSGFALLSRSPYQDVDGTTREVNSSIYQAPSGASVFAAGTMSWSWALDRAGYTDTRIQKTTANILERFSKPLNVVR